LAHNQRGWCRPLPRLDSIDGGETLMAKTALVTGLPPALRPQAIPQTLGSARDGWYSQTGGKNMNHRTATAIAIVGSVLTAAFCPQSAVAGELLGCDAFTTAIGMIDRDTAEWTEIGISGVIITGMTYDFNHGILYGISPNTDALYEIDRYTAGARVVGAPGALGYENANGLAYDPINDIIYGTDNNTNTLFTVDPITGVATAIAELGGGFTEIEGLGFEPGGGILYGLTQLQRRIVQIDVESGEASAPQIFADAHIYSFDPVGGRLDYRGDTIGVDAVQGLAFVPEPSAILLCLAAIPLALARRSSR